jgi:hypothetical protein
MGWLNLPLCESTAGTAALWPCCAARTNLAAPKQSMRRKVGRPLLPKARKEPRISCRSAAIRCRHNHVPTLDSHHAATYTVRFILTGTERPVCPRALGPILPQSHHDPRSTFFPRLPHEHNPPGIPHQDQTPAPSSAPHSKTLTSPSPFLPVAPSRRRHRTRPIGQIQRQTSPPSGGAVAPTLIRHDTIRRATPSACTHTRPHILPQLACQAVPRAQWFTLQRSTRVLLKSPHTVGLSVVWARRGLILTTAVLCAVPIYVARGPGVRSDAARPAPKLGPRTNSRIRR